MLIDAKSNLAKLLATENLSVELKKCDTAYFDLKNRKLIIPILIEGLTNDLYDLFIGHEVSHALHTPLDGWHNSTKDLGIPRVVINILEDARIEKLIKRKYPGLKASFSRGYRELVNRNFFEIDGKDVNKLNFLDRINLYFKIGASINVKFAADEQIIVNDLADAETFDEIIEIAKRIVDQYKKQAKENKSNKKNDSDENDSEESDGTTYGVIDIEDEGDSEESDESGESEESDSDDSGNESDESKNDSGAEDEKSEDEKSIDSKGTPKEDEDENKEDDSNVNDGAGSGDDEEMPDIESITDEAQRNNEKNLIEDKVDYVYANLPTNFNMDKVVMSYKEVIQGFITPQRGIFSPQHFTFVSPNEYFIFNEFKIQSKPIVSYLVKEFELRKNAVELKNTAVAKTGDLNLSKIHEYKFTDDIFKRVNVVPGAKSHGLVMFIDWSGSMQKIMQNTIKQMLNLVLFCKKVNIPFEVYAFSANGLANHMKYNSGDIMFKSFRLLNLMSSKMNANEFMIAGTGLLKFGMRLSKETQYNQYSRSPYDFDFPAWMSINSTPLNEALIVANEIVPKFQKDNKIQFVNVVVLSDGEAHPLSQIYGSKESFLGYNPYGIKMKGIFRHVPSGISVPVPGRTSYQTYALLKILKGVTNARIVGFHLISENRHFKEAVSLFEDNVAIKDKLFQEYIDNGKCIALKTAGYDEHYIMNAGISIDDDLDDRLAKTSTKEGMKNAMVKHNQAQIMNRVILQKFIKMIA